ncbi:hypothetical protein Clacol_008400 [Clathrus columnatus]|uniref:MAGE domain-containing protein n=1 Tax=Clathrus columnatus TaxID=1419009 RepID=A0AAV5AMK6_9AGAM|nr:hypothetical protein Clacol_008400 [Clathrus columnatus]
MPGKASHPSANSRKKKASRADTTEKHSQRTDDENLDDQGTDDGGESATDIARKANDLIRLAMFTESLRIPLKRDEITKKIFGGRTAKDQFDRVFERAQETLRNTFGMELHELMSRAEKHRAEAAREGANENGDITITGVKRKASGPSSRQYMLRSILDPRLIEAASLVDADIEEAERKEYEDFYPNDEDRPTKGTLIICGVSDDGYQLSLTGILHVLLALILVNGRALSDMQLRTYLKRLRLPLGAQPPTTLSDPAGNKITIEMYLTQLVKQSYLERQKVNAAPQGGQKRTRTGINICGEDGESNFEWKWGSRAIAEVGEEGIGDFVIDFMENIEELRKPSEDADSAAENDDREIEQVGKRRDKLLKAIGRAAGGGLEPYQ